MKIEVKNLENAPLPMTRIQTSCQILKSSSSALTMAIMTIRSTAILVILTRYNENSLAYMAPIAFMQNLFNGPIGAFLCSTAIRTTPNPRESSANIGATISASWRFATLFSIPTILVGVFSEPLLRALGQPNDVAAAAQSYFRRVAFGVPAGYIVMSNTQAALGLRHPWVMPTIYGIQGIIAIGASVPLIFGYFGLPTMGMNGYALTTAGANWITMAMTMIYFTKSDFEKYEIFRCHKNFWEQSRALKKIGFPALLKSLNEQLSQQICLIMIGWMGKDALKSFNVVWSLLRLAIMPVNGLSQGVAVVIKNVLTGNLLGDVYRVANIGAVFGSVISTTFGIMFWRIPQALLGMFMDTSDPNNKAIVSTSRLLLLMSCGGLIQGLGYVAEGALRGREKTRFPMWMGILNLSVITLPLAYALAYPVGLGELGVMAAYMIGSAGYTLSLWSKWGFGGKTTSVTTADNAGAGTVGEPGAAAGTQPLVVNDNVNIIVQPEAVRASTVDETKPLLAKNETGSAPVSCSFFGYVSSCFSSFFGSANSDVVVTRNTSVSRVTPPALA